MRSVDLNIIFYEWLLSDECAELLLEQLEESDWPEDAKTAYKTIFLSVGDFRETLDNFRAGASGLDGERLDDYVSAHYLAVKTLEIYLDAVSILSERFVVSPYEFRLAEGELDSARLGWQLEAPPPLLYRFFEEAVRKYIVPQRARLIGISCIGQEQLFLTLLLGAIIKVQLDVPVIVGGTILSRVHERGALPAEWFGRYFDIVVRNEGERPTERMLSNLRAGRPLTADVPSVVYRDHDSVVSSSQASPLPPSEIPVPDFDDMPLGRYVSQEVTLPLLSSRGCYWGKCEFCHHGMVYGEKYAGYGIEQVLDTVGTLSSRHGVHHFAFNDEAIPPKLMRTMGERFQAHEVSGWSFTGLIKFEKFFQRDDFVNLHTVGFRSLYVGLESASEHVLRLMKKNNKKETIERNLRDATTSGIWMHCFLFFGFPGEREVDAQETYDFVLSNSDIISSFGSATFVLEHNAPIYHHTGDFGLQLRPSHNGNVDVYYQYDIAEGIGPERALEWMNKINDATLDIPSYNATGWIPRELQLCLLSVMTPQELVNEGLAIRNFSGIPRRATLAQLTSRVPDPRGGTGRVVVNRVNGRVLAINGKAAELFDFCYDHDLALEEIEKRAPIIFERLSTSSGKLTSDAVMLPVHAPL